MWYENKRRNRVYGEPDPVLAADNGMKGMTEIESESGIFASFSQPSLQDRSRLPTFLQTSTSDTSCKKPTKLRPSRVCAFRPPPQSYGRFPCFAARHLSDRV